jgi:hypothetical protein
MEDVELLGDLVLILIVAVGVWWFLSAPHEEP